MPLVLATEDNTSGLFEFREKQIRASPDEQEIR